MNIKQLNIKQLCKQSGTDYLNLKQPETEVHVYIMIGREKCSNNNAAMVSIASDNNAHT